VTDERKRLERQRIEEERLANGEATELIPENGEDGDGIRKSTDTRVPTGPMPEIERGLCVVCQDEEATLAVVDCGCVVRVSRWIQLISVLRHLAMCARKFMILTSAKLRMADCSDLIMATSQECPLCRTRIVTPYVIRPLLTPRLTSYEDNGSSGYTVFDHDLYSIDWKLVNIMQDLC